MVGSVIALISDFGTGSGYVAQMKAALWESYGEARFVDVSHDLPAQDIRGASVLLRSVAFAFGPGSTHLVVVDPGVGTGRRAIAVRAKGVNFVGPDNGVLSVALEQEDAEVFEIDAPHLYRQPVSKTFHGRDVFAPIAAELAAGLPLCEIGHPIDDAVVAVQPEADLDSAGVVHGEVVGCDAFGNLLTNIDANLLPNWQKAAIAGQSCPRFDTYGAAGAGTLCALVGSGGKIELAVAMGSAAERIGGDVVGLAVTVSL